MGISVGLVGMGQFGQHFVELFARHPLVDRIAICDQEPRRIEPFFDKEFLRGKFEPRDAFDSLEAVCKSDVDAVAVFTQPWLHAPQCIQAMEAGKHAYSAVPVVRLFDGDATQQARLVMENLRHVLAAEGLMLGDVIKTTIFLSDMENFAKVNEVYASYFGDYKPARACVAVKSLPKNVDVEIEAIALAK